MHVKGAALCFLVKTKQNKTQAAESSYILTGLPQVPLLAKDPTLNLQPEADPAVASLWEPEINNEGHQD